MLSEVASLQHSGSLVRIPPADDVPLTDRVKRLLDTEALRRLSGISQLGMVSLVYPGATHSRLEHTLGVYCNALRLLARFANDEAFQSQVDPTQQEAFVVAALVHDIGHWPYCHPIEDMNLDVLEEHESRVGDWLQQSELAEAIDEDWSCSREQIVGLLAPGRQGDDSSQLLRSCLSGPIDIDKLDYLQRDSLHAGVPYGRNFDVGRLIHSLCVHPQKPQLAIGEKGRTAAEMMVFSRYIMFSEVYWHHAVRSATAMLQRAVFLLQNRIDLKWALRLGDADWRAMLVRAAEGSVAEPLVDGIFGSRRRLYKRVAEFNVLDGLDVHRKLARRPYWWLQACNERLAEALSRQSGTAVFATDVLIDAPPVKLEVDINVDIVGKDGGVRSLGETSPLASVLADKQFDDHVKRVRIFVQPDLRQPIAAKIEDWSQLLLGVIESLENDLA